MKKTVLRNYAKLIAVTGAGVLAFIREREALIAETAKELKVQNPADLAKRAAQMQAVWMSR